MAITTIDEYKVKLHFEKKGITQCSMCKPSENEDKTFKYMVTRQVERHEFPRFGNEPETKDIVMITCERCGNVTLFDFYIIGK